MSLRFSCRLCLSASALIVYSLIGVAFTVEAQTPLNGGFESGFTGFETIGNATIQGTGFGTGPTEGSNLALLTNDFAFGGAGPAPAVGIGDFLGGDGGFFFDDDLTEGSALSFEVFGEVGSSLSFDFNFFTSEATPNVGFNDAAFLTIDGQVVSTLADSNSSFSPSDVASTTFPQETGFSNFEFAFENAGPVNVGFAVLDEGDTIVSSALAIDNILVVPTTEPQPMPSGNLSFESGDFSGFSVTGNASIEDASFGVAPSDGETQALLTTDFSANDAADIELLFDLEPGTLAALGGTNGSAIAFEVQGVEGETISFDYSFLTDEFTPNPFNDFAVVSLISDDSSVFEILGDTNDVFTLSPTIFSEQTALEQFSFTFDTTGEFTVGIAVLNEGDTAVNSGLLLDNISIVPEPSSGVLLLGSFLGLMISRRRK